MFETDEISLDSLKEYERSAIQAGRPGAHFAWFLDRSQGKREEGCTADIKFRDFTTSKNNLWAIDTPGHDDHVDRVVAAMSEADACILVVDQTNRSKNPDPDKGVKYGIGLYNISTRVNAMQLISR